MKLLSRVRTFLVAFLLVTTAACGDAAKDYYAKGAPVLPHVILLPNAS
jgi:hypothetical protein